jgi:hypothetical protein
VAPKHGITIRELITAQRVQEGRERTYADLTRAAGGKPSAPRWQQLATSDDPFDSAPDTDTIMGIAQALRVHWWTVYLACGNTIAKQRGLDTGDVDSLFVALLPPGTDGLLEPHRQLVLSLVDALLELARLRAATSPRTSTEGPTSS